MAQPNVMFLAGEDVWEFTELANTTGSTFLHTETHTASYSDDSDAVQPTIAVTYAHIPNPAVVPGAVDVVGHFLYNSSGVPPWSGDIDFKFSVQDKLLDFLREGQTLTQKIKVRVQDNDGEFVDKIMTVKVHGKNDTPVAAVDIKSTGENTGTYTMQVTGNDFDPDKGDHLRVITSSVQSVTSEAASYFTKSMVKVTNVNFSGNSAGAKDAVKVTLDKAFQGLATGENALVVIKYTIADDLDATSASEFRLTVTGQDDAQIIGTNSSDKFLFGEKNADDIYGLNGDDWIRSRGGHDNITGGAGKDKFIFLTKGDSSKTNPDDIMDFKHNEDLIDLSAFSGTFEFRGKNAFNGGHDIRYVDMGSYLRVEVDTNGDMTVDMKIDVHGVTSLVKEDFVL